MTAAWSAARPDSERRRGRDPYELRLLERKGLERASFGFLRLSLRGSGNAIPTIPRSGSRSRGVRIQRVVLLGGEDALHCPGGVADFGFSDGIADDTGPGVLPVATRRIAA